MSTDSRELVKAAKIRAVRRDLNNQWNIHGVPHLADRQDLYIADHMALRLVERKLEKDIPFIITLTRYFMAQHFYPTTYTNRVYTIQLRDLKVGIMIQTGKESGRRFAILSTVFTNQQNYECDEHINLK